MADELTDLVVDDTTHLTAEQRAVVEADEEWLTRPMDVPPVPRRTLPEPPKEATP